MAQATTKRAPAARGNRAKGGRSGKVAAGRKADSRAIASAALSDSATLFQMRRIFTEVGGIVCCFTAVIIALALLTFNSDDPGWSHTGTNTEIHNSVGRAGAWFADVSFYLFGFMAYLMPAMLAAAGWLLFRDRKKPQATSYKPFVFVRIIGIILMLVAASGLADLHFAVSEGSLPRGTFGGGILGTEVAWRLVAFLHPLGTTLLLLALFFCSLTLAFGTSWIQLIEAMGALVLRLFDMAGAVFEKLSEQFVERQKVREASRIRRARLRGNAATPIVDDPLLDERAGEASPVKGGGLAAALALAREKARAKSGIADKLLGAESDAASAAKKASSDTGGNKNINLDANADSLAEDDLDDIPVLQSPVKAALARAKARSSAGTNGADAADPQSGGTAPAATSRVARANANEASSVVQGTAQGHANAASNAVAAVSKKKIAIKQRAPEQQQTKMLLDVPDSEMPPISLLDAPQQQSPGFTDEELEALSRLLEDKLAEFRIAVEVVAVHPGPVITRFEMQLAPGIKASRITNLSQDIARSLSLVSVRVVEVIPGKSTIGIEVPNDHREIVQLSEMVQSSEYTDKTSPLTIALGKDISGTPVTADLGKMPHLLVAGTTGSGKSVAVNAMLVSLLYKATPNDLRLILIDPKMLELNVYDGIPHLLTPVVTDMKEAANALRWCVGEMERRYTLMAELKVRNIAGFNKKIAEAEAAGTPIVDPLYKAELSLEPTAAPPTLESMPFIVVVVDEFADMMMQVGKKAEEMIARIAQKARAAGIHLILATQRPSVDVITGLIKANIPTRIAFQVSQKVDSRTILDQGGAESLLGHGDMLYLPPGTAVPIRVHGAFVDDHEVNNVSAHVRQTGEPNYIEAILHESSAPIPGLTASGDDAGAEADELYDQAVAIVTESRKASISYVQRRLKIGYNRAARMVEEMENAGVVSQVTGSGTREVLAPPPV